MLQRPIPRGRPPTNPEERVDDRHIERARAGDLDAREEIFEAWLPVVLGWCARLGGPRVDPEDAAHDVFMVVIRRLHTLQRTEAFSSWLFGITRRVLRQHRRRSWVTRWLPDREIDDVPDLRLGVEAGALSKELCLQVWRVLEDLPSAQREVLVLTDIEDRTLKEVSEILGVAQGTVASRVRLARTKFERYARSRRLNHLIQPEVDP